MFERAAALTPDRRLRDERTLAAARAQRAAGALEAALRLLDTLDRAPRSELQAAHVERLRGKIAFDQKRGIEAAELLLSAAGRFSPLDLAMARETHVEALAAAVWSAPQSGNDLLRRAATGALALPVGDDGGSTTSDLLMRALATRITEGYTTAAPLLHIALEAARDHHSAATDLDDLLWMAGNRMAAMLAAESWDFETSRLLALRQVSATREAGALVQLQFGLNFLANNVVLAGDVHAAEALVDEERWLATITGVPPVAYGGMLVEAYRDDPSVSAPMVERALAAATKEGEGRVLAFLNYVNAVLSNGLGRHRDALLSARRVIESDTLGYQPFAIGELAEAAFRLGDRDQLRQSATWMGVRVEATPTS
jgi:hypothetical protein